MWIFLCAKYSVWLNYAWWKMSVGLHHVFYFSAIQLEREYEMKRLNNLKCEENVAEEIQFSLRERPVGLRRPLPPKWQSSHSWICTLCFLHPKRMKDSDLPLCEVWCSHLNAPWWMSQLPWVSWQLWTDLLGPSHVFVPLYHKQQYCK